MNYNVQCWRCKQNHVVTFNRNDYLRWKDGWPIQEAMPYLTADEGELLVSGTCGTCFDAMFK